MTLNIDHLSLEFSERDVLIPVDATDKEKGTVTVRLREIPYAVKKSLDLRFYAASEQIEKARGVLTKIGKGEDVAHADIDRIGEAFGSLRAAQLEIIKWAVCGHDPKAFTYRGEPVLFETVDAIVAGVKYQVASPKMLRLYPAVSRDAFDTINSSFLANLALAARAFQSGEPPLTDEVWAAYAA